MSHLPQLREDIQLLKGPSAQDGSPTWQLFDPVRNQHFRIGLHEFHVLSHWHLRQPNLIINAVKKSEDEDITEDDIMSLYGFLLQNNLLSLSHPAGVDYIKEQATRMDKKKHQSFFKSYLFFRIPLWHPDAFLEKTLPFVKWFFKKGILIFLSILVVISLFLLARQWHEFTATFVQFFNVEGIMYYVLAILVTKVIHELGHAYTTKYFGARVNSIGVAFLVLWPVLYTDTTDAWRLTSRWQRVGIAIAGMAAEIAFATVLLFCWFFLAPGPLKNACYFIVTVSWVVTLLVNLNPCMRFDGYYLLADLLDIANLQNVSFALGKWQLRKWLFGFQDETPYPYTGKLKRFLIGYAYATWIYRFFLFLSIAFLMYLFLFKLLGILLMLSVVIMLCILPIVKELKLYYERRGDMRWNKQAITSASVIGALLLLLLVPLPFRTAAPALLGFTQVESFYPARAGKIIVLNVKTNQQVQKGELLIKVSSPELQFDIKKTKAEIALLKLELKQEFKTPSLDRLLRANKEELIKKQNKIEGYQQIEKSLSITAPFNGKVAYLANPVHLGMWIKQKTKLITLINPDKTDIIALIKSRTRHYLAENQLATFIANEPKVNNISAKIDHISHSNLKQLNSPYLSSEHGGDIAVTINKDNQSIPNQSIYQITLTPTSTVNLQHELPGRVLLHTKSRSIIALLWENTVGLLIRESQF